MRLAGFTDLWRGLMCLGWCLVIWGGLMGLGPRSASGLEGGVLKGEGGRSAAGVFSRFAPKVRVRSEGGFLWVESDGLPSHSMMIGITAWQQQVPLPQPYRGSNAWRIPQEPVAARVPVAIKDRFLRGAIAVAANGVPIFNPQNNRGEIAAEIGELDAWGGHCGRADDYHYHTAPLHLEKELGAGFPIAYALDGYAIYGLKEPDGSVPTGLDEFRGHQPLGQEYHYHASKSYPYVNGGFHGEVVEKDGQVDPQPRARPVRPALQALRGAKVTKFEVTGENRFKLSYEVGGMARAVVYSMEPDGTFPFEFQNGGGQVVREIYREGREGGDGKGGRGVGEERFAPEGGPRKPWIQAHGMELDSDGDGTITWAEFMDAAGLGLASWDSNKDKKVQRSELLERGGGRSVMGGFIQQHFEELDVNRDGVLGEEELLREVRRMFEKEDRNRDGKIGPEEWRDASPGLRGGTGMEGRPPGKPRKPGGERPPK